MTTDQIHFHVSQAFDQLTDRCHTAFAVAEKLRRLKHQGIIGDAGSCPLAMYLREFLPDCAIEVSHVAVDVFPQRFANAWVMMTLPTLLMRFARDFDAKKFPELIAEEIVERHVPAKHVHYSR